MLGAPQVVDKMAETATVRGVSNSTFDPDSDFPVRIGKMAIADRLRQAVSAAGGPTAVANRAGMPLPTLNHYLSGRHEMKVGAFITLAAACGVSLDWLATGTGPENPDETVAENQPAREPAELHSSSRPAVGTTVGGLNEPRENSMLPVPVVPEILAQAIEVIIALHGAAALTGPPKEIAARLAAVYNILSGAKK